MSHFTPYYFISLLTIVVLVIFYNNYFIVFLHIFSNVLKAYVIALLKYGLLSHHFGHVTDILFLKNLIIMLYQAFNAYNKSQQMI